jgi:hypothetical protein
MHKGTPLILWVFFLYFFFRFEAHDPIFKHILGKALVHHTKCRTRYAVETHQNTALCGYALLNPNEVKKKFLETFDLQKPSAAYSVFCVPSVFPNPLHRQDLMRHGVCGGRGITELIEDSGEDPASDKDESYLIHPSSRAANCKNSFFFTKLTRCR